MTSKLSIKQKVVFRAKVKFLGKVQQYVWLLKSNWGNAYSIALFHKRPTERQVRAHMRSTKRHFTTAILNGLIDPQKVLSPEYRNKCDDELANNCSEIDKQQKVLSDKVFIEAVKSNSAIVTPFKIKRVEDNNG